MFYTVSYIKFQKAVNSLIKAKEDRTISLFSDSVQVNSVLCDGYTESIKMA
jgi:hypothetical protein